MPMLNRSEESITEFAETVSATHLENNKEWPQFKSGMSLEEKKKNWGSSLAMKFIKLW